jgi:hypothetical protein
MAKVELSVRTRMVHAALDVPRRDAEQAKLTPVGVSQPVR